MEHNDEGADNLQGEQGHIKNPRNSMNIQGAQGVGIACARARAHDHKGRGWAGANVPTCAIDGTIDGVMGW